MQSQFLFNTISAFWKNVTILLRHSESLNASAVESWSSVYGQLLSQSVFKLRARLNIGKECPPEFVSFSCNVIHYSNQGWNGTCAQVLNSFVVWESQGKFSGVIKLLAWIEGVICRVEWSDFCGVNKHLPTVQKSAQCRVLRPVPSGFLWSVWKPTPIQCVGREVWWHLARRVQTEARTSTCKNARCKQEVPRLRFGCDA